jgi:hypothetical protein
MPARYPATSAVRGPAAIAVPASSGYPAPDRFAVIAAGTTVLYETADGVVAALAVTGRGDGQPGRHRREHQHARPQHIRMHNRTNAGTVRQTL